uniref:DUF5672 domain-containing protein n=1 Tax=viral metagenome TaxID=1070528 RepID=A0A6C0C071_9ZZZZ
MPINLLLRHHQMHNMFATSNGYVERHMQRQMQDKNKRVMFLRKQRQLQLTRDKQKREKQNREKQNRVKYTQNSIQMNLGIRDASKPNTKKEIHRQICLSNLPFLRNIKINNFGDKSGVKETVLIEFRPLPHLEFLLRNTIIKLNDWNHTFVCGTKNYEMVKKMCETIHKDTESKIKIIKLDIDNLVPKKYSDLLMTKDFWNRFVGEKILIYQEDTMLFHGNISPFLKYDYIGAPWKIPSGLNKNGVGNGGFSLRSKSIMIECIDKIKPFKSGYIPEDVYFSKSMIDNNLGTVAPHGIANTFSQETLSSANPLGGHCFWLADNRIDNNYYMNAYR